MPEIRVQATRYTVNCLPEDNINARHFAIHVEYRGRGLWAVTDGFGCLGRSGMWDYESIPSERTDEWLAEHRFTEDEALALAKEAAPLVMVNGWTVERVLAQIAESEAGQ